MVPLPNTLPGMNSVGTMAAAKSGNTGSPLGRRRNRRSGMNTGTNRASARRKSTVIGSKSGSGVHNGSDDSTSVAPRRPPSTVLISVTTAVTIGTSVIEPGGIVIDSRITPRRMLASSPASPDVFTWLA
jgi:hypothetical protein